MEVLSQHSVRRLGPIVTPAMLPGNDGANINGPSLIKVPEWVADPLGAYYLYFAHHKGTYIRLAYAEALSGPWRVYEPGSLSLGDCSFLDRHIASPDVHVDDERRRIVMYFHGPTHNKAGQMTFVATSADGLAFDPLPSAIGRSYARIFRHNHWHYGLFGSGEIELSRSQNGITEFESGPIVFPETNRDSGRPRHVAVQKVSENRLLVYFTCKGVAPERIMVGQIDMTGDWLTWQVKGVRELLRPNEQYEGANLPLKLSKRGEARRPRNELRDPAIYEENGRTWLQYAIAGESGIALAELTFLRSSN